MQYILSFENASNGGVNGNDNAGSINSGSDETSDPQDSTETVVSECFVKRYGIGQWHCIKFICMIKLSQLKKSV